MPPLLPFTPLDQDCEWIASRFTFPEKVRDGGALIQPLVILWMELPSGVLLGSTLVNPRNPVSLGETFEEALRNPDEGLPRRPARIRVPDERMAKELRRAAGGIPIVVAPVPELDSAFAELTEEMGGEEPPPTYLGKGETSPAVVKKYFSAAALLFRAAPWRHVQEYQVMRIDIPRFDIDNACLSVIGAGRNSLGILLFRSIHDFVAFGRKAVDPGIDATEEIALRSVSFDRKKDTPPSLIREIEQHRWPIAGSKAYPALICVDEEMSPIQATERDFRIMTACTHAFLAFFEQHRGIFEVEAPDEICESFTSDDHVTVTITAPYDPEEIANADKALGDLAALGDADSIEIASARSAAGRNDPCPCGSGKKYKKCHLESDERER